MAPNQKFDKTRLLLGQSLVDIKKVYLDEGLSLYNSFGKPWSYRAHGVQLLDTTSSGSRSYR